ncbi:hypothetical protein ABZ616_20365 [Streptomyces noursei]|uniref:hypothetical protein n=1 Tax=Streptomyces noursei TaxID=1971 RepID=UPI0033FC28F5
MRTPYTNDARGHLIPPTGTIISVLVLIWIIVLAISGSTVPPAAAINNAVISGSAEALVGAVVVRRLRCV